MKIDIYMYSKGSWLFGSEVDIREGLWMVYVWRDVEYVVLIISWYLVGYS